MRSDPAAFVLPPVVAAARLRAPRHRRKSRDLANNYIAETSVSIGNKKRNRKKPGAPPGNLNAFKHGARSAEIRAYRAHVHALVTAARQTLKLRALALKMQKTDRP